MARRVKDITKYKPTKEDSIVEPDGKLLVCHFDKKFGHADKLKAYDRFLIGKKSCINRLVDGDITDYINYFMKYYDKDDELISAYLKLKYALDKEKTYNADNMDAFIDMVYQVMFTNNIVDNIIAMTDDNYKDDIEVSTEAKQKYKNAGKKYLESLEFKNIHIKILLEISFSMRVIAPVLFHYCITNQIKLPKGTDIIFKFYKNLFKIFGHGETWEVCDLEGNILESDLSNEVVRNDIETRGLKPTIVNYEKQYHYLKSGQIVYYRQTPIDLYNKIYVYVKAKVLESNSINARIFKQKEIFGEDVATVIHHFVRYILISDNIIKFTFNGNITGFIKTIVRYQLNYFLKEKYDKNLSEVTDTKNSDGLSGSDKLIMNQNKIDEGIVTLTDINIVMTIKNIEKELDIYVSEDEIDYYIKHHKPNHIQTCLVYAYYTKYFGNFRDLNILTRRQYMKLMLILKKKLILDLGYTNENEIHETYLPYIISGNLVDKVNTRIIRNNKFMAKIETNYLYTELINSKYRLLESIKPDYILGLISQLINTRFTYVLYEQQDKTGTDIIYSDDKISDELLFFLNTI